MGIQDNQVESVFIAQAINVGWIIEKLMEDIAQKLKEKRIRVRIGEMSKYGGEQIVFHSRYLYAKPIKSAKLNSIFVTHIDDKLKEFEIRKDFDLFDSFVCLSAQDADLLKSIGCPSRAVLGNNLPHRGISIRPIKIAIFSELYDDGRKNENWILEYLTQLPKELRNGVVLCMLGYNWERFCIDLAKIGASYELYRYDRDLPLEYTLQKEILARMDYLLYPAFDGGAMCVYDAISEGIKLIISNVSFHKNLITGSMLFSTKKEFYDCMDEVMSHYSERTKVQKERSVDVYVENLVSHWAEILSSSGENDHIMSSQQVQVAEKDTLDFYRSHYKKITFNRLSSATYRMLRKILLGG